jgi:hypothetical protein
MAVAVEVRSLLAPLMAYHRIDIRCTRWRRSASARTTVSRRTRTAGEKLERDRGHNVVAAVGRAASASTKSVVSSVSGTWHRRKNGRELASPPSDGN